MDSIAEEQPESPMNEFGKRAKLKKKKPITSDIRRVVRLQALPPRVWDARRIMLPYEEINFETFGIARPEDEIAPGHYGYQREEVGEEVRELSEVLRRGGGSEPIHVVSRAWEAKSPKRRYWIVDGQQRMWAAVDARKGIAALVHEVETPEEERGLFAALNNRRRVSTNLTIWNHNGPISKLLISESEDPLSPLYHRVSFGNSTKTKVSANVLLRCMAVVAGMSGGNVNRLLASLDHYINKGGLSKLREFLRTLGLVFLVPPPGLPLGNPQLAAFAKSWKAASGIGTDAKTIARLRKTAAGLPAVVAATYQERVDLMYRRFLRILKPRQEAA